MASLSTMKKSTVEAKPSPEQQDGSTLQTVNPATGETLREYPAYDLMDVEGRLDRAQAAFKLWKRVSLSDRCEVIQAAAEELTGRREELAALITAEMGKPIAQAEAEIDKCVWLCEHYTKHASEYLSPTNVDTEARLSAVRFDPLGVVLMIMPWNYPFWQVFRCAIPALLAGNTVVLKHAGIVSGCALAIEDVLSDTKVVPDLFSTLLLSRENVDMLISHEAVQAVSLTGSEQAGRSVGSMAGQFLKKSVLELGGSDPFIVLSDAAIEHAADQAVQARMQNTGQSCIAAKRFIVEESVYDEFLGHFVQKCRELKVGDPTDRSMDLGPMAREDLRDDLHTQVMRSVGAGARELCGGEPLDRPGFYYPPTVLGDVTPGMAAFDEELFGPVAAICRATDRDHAIELANQSKYGLGASVWTRSTDTAMEVAEQIDSGAVFFNSIVKSDPRLPFGGIKDSGYGRELSQFGIREFVNVKTVLMEPVDS